MKVTMSTIRNLTLAKIHVGKKALGMDDDTYRAFLQAQVGKRSAADCTIIELQAVLHAMKRRGFVPQSSKPVGKNPGAPKTARSRQAVLDKITAQLTTRGLHWNYAHGMAKRMFNKERVQWLNDEQLYKLMQALQVDQNRRKRRTVGEVNDGQD